MQIKRQYIVKHYNLLSSGTAVSKCLKSHGDLKLAFVITKGQFELDVICAKELTGSSTKKPGEQQPFS